MNRCTAEPMNWLQNLISSRSTTYLLLQFYCTSPSPASIQFSIFITGECQVSLQEIALVGLLISICSDFKGERRRVKGHFSMAYYKWVGLVINRVAINQRGMGDTLCYPVIGLLLKATTCNDPVQGQKSILFIFLIFSRPSV